MVFSHKAQQSMEQIAIVIAAIVGLVVILLIYSASSASFLNFDFFSETACWGSNGVRCGGGIFTLVPNLCTIEKVEIESEEDLANALRTTYYMYHQSTCDFNNIGGQVYTVYYFNMEEEIDISKFMGYLFEHNRGKEELDVSKTDIAYLEENTVGKTICFDMRYDEIKNYTLKADQTYYVHYWDRDTLFSDKGDRIMITRDAHMTTTQEQLEDTFIPEITAKGIATNYALAVATGGAYYVIKSGYYLIVSSEVEDEFCLDYGLEGA
jgi:hypothetical protein